MTSAVRTDRDAFEPRDWGLFLSVSAIWGASFLFIDIALESFHPGFVTWLRVGLGAATLALLPHGPARFDDDDRRRILALSVVWVAVPFTLFPLAEQHINSAVTGILNGAMPIFAGLIGGIFFGRPSGRPQRLGLGVGFAGILVVSLAAGAGGSTAWTGVAMVLLATASYGLAVNIAGPVQQRHGSVAVMARTLAYATLWVTPFGLYGLFHSAFAVAPTVANAVLGIVGTGLAFAIMATLVGRVGGPRASFITYLIPVVALILGATFRGDRVAPVALLGVVMVIGGAVLASRREA